MKVYDPSKPLISIHIPKCAGASFQVVLESWFGHNYRRHYHDEPNDSPPEKHALYLDDENTTFRPGLCIHGHFNHKRGNGVTDYYPEADQLITIIRDPFEHYLSHYFYAVRLLRDGRAYRAGKKHSLADRSPTLGKYLQQVRRSHICSFLPPGISLDNYREVLEASFVYIGITEELQRSVDILAQTLGFQRAKVPTINASERTEPIPDGAREEFEVNNPLEMAIYRFARDNWGNTP